jgi:methionine-rich copper-binding protein CopC
MGFPTCARGLFLALVAWVLSVGLALGHSGLQRTEPPAESKLKRPPSEVKLYFTERLEPAYSTVRVTDDNGAHVDPSNPSSCGRHCSRLSKAPYTANWRVLSVDGHVTEGRFTFQVK